MAGIDGTREGPSLLAWRQSREGGESCLPWEAGVTIPVLPHDGGSGYKVTFLGAHSPSSEPGLGLCLLDPKTQVPHSAGLPMDAGWKEGLEDREEPSR